VQTDGKDFDYQDELPEAQPGQFHANITWILHPKRMLSVSGKHEEILRLSRVDQPLEDVLASLSLS
jgi:hypothetical protein